MLPAHADRHPARLKSEENLCAKSLWRLLVT